MSWESCKNCGQTAAAEQWRQNLFVCNGCGFHRRVGIHDRLEMVLDPDSFIEQDADLMPGDPLQWKSSGKVYRELVASASAKTNTTESFVYGTGVLDKHRIVCGGFNFSFLGGTLGSVAGEKIARMFELASEKQLPVIVFTSTGGARMQEGMISLMQMSKIAVSLASARQQGIPLITIICDPTTGGVAASLAFMGDVVLAEPNALAGFAGPRVILQTIGEEMPEGIQKTDRLCHDGFVDEVVPRGKLRARLSRRLHAFQR